MQCGMGAPHLGLNQWQQQLAERRRSKANIKFVGLLLMSIWSARALVLLQDFTHVRSSVLRALGQVVDGVPRAATHIPAI